MVRAGIGVLCVATVFWLHARFVLVHFTQGALLFDTGWFAWIMASGDPWLTDPRAIDGLSYFNYHLTPYLSAISVVVHAIGADRFVAYAIHQGAAFALVAGSLCGLVLTTWRGCRSGLLLAAAVIEMTIGDVTLQVASLPHPEVAIVAFCLMGSALWLNRHRGWGTVAFAVACLVREDGGLYAAAFLVALALLQPLGRDTPRSREIALSVAAVVVSLLMFCVKSWFFPGFSAFAFNYSGNHWDHLTAENLGQRLREFATNPQVLTTIVPALLLAVVSWRYLLFPALMAPLIVAQLLAARAHLWEFHYYYALPFLVIWAGSVVVAADRSRRAVARGFEPAVLLVSAILGSAPLLFMLSGNNSLPVLGAALVQPVEDVSALSQEATRRAADVPDLCVSTSIAAIAPDSFGPEQILGPDLNVNRCKTVFLYDGDPYARTLSWKLIFWPSGAHLSGHVRRFDSPG